MRKKTCLLVALLLFGKILPAQQVALYGVVTESDSIVPFVNVAVFNEDDSSMVSGTVSDLSGDYSIDLEKGKYIVKATCIGYKPYFRNVDLSEEDYVNVDIQLELDSEMLGEVNVIESRAKIGLNKSSYTFTSEQIQSASEARDLVKEMPELHISAVDNKLSTIDGKSILILINGVKASDGELELIRAKNVTSVELYKVPPLRYANDAEVVVNVKVKPEENGIVGEAYVRAGQMYSQARGMVALISGRNKLTFDIGTHINHNRDVKDEESGVYKYDIQSSNYEYDYSKKYNEWGNQNSASLIWQNQLPDDYTLQMTASIAKSTTKTDGSGTSMFCVDTNSFSRESSQSDRIKSLNPSLDLYFSKNFSQSSFIATDILYSNMSNEQKSLSTEINVVDSAVVFADMLDMQADKQLLAGEVYYSYSNDVMSLEFGYQGQRSFLKNTIKNTLADNSVDNVNIWKHYLYAESTAEFGNFMYDFGLGATFDSREDGFSNWTFTPKVNLGYYLNRKNVVNLNFSSYTEMPTLQQMSENKILIMQNFYSSGNKDVENSTNYSLSAQYTFQPSSSFFLMFNVDYNYTYHKLFEKYVERNGAINLLTMNAHDFSEVGPSLYLMYKPIKCLEFSVQGSATYQMFTESKGAETVDNWFFPLYFNAQYSYGDFSCSYLQMYGNHMLNGLKKEGYEKVSYVDINYKLNNFTFGVQCLFPFIEDKFSNKTTSSSLVYNSSKSNLKTKNRALSLSITWNFAKGKDLDSQKILEISDYDDARFMY